MIAVQFIILFIIISLIIGIMLYFFNKNKEIERVYLYKIGEINQTISLHKEQINYRINSLQCYDFLKYNLNESLIPQPKIKLN